MAVSDISHRTRYDMLKQTVPLLIILCMVFPRAVEGKQNGIEGVIRRIKNPSSALYGELTRYGMTAWEYEMPSGPDAGIVPYLLYSPSVKAKSSRGLPMLLYFGGTGETGSESSDLVRQFRVKTIFKKTTSEGFQRVHPCYLFVPMVRNHREFRCAYPEKPSRQARQIMCAMLALVESLGKGAVDTNRLYTTGLSFGGCAAFEMVSSYPSIFAASIPVAATESEFMIPESHKIDVWWIENNMALAPEWKAMYRRFKDKIEARGGEFRFSAYPSNKHNAWDDAWSECGTWDWLFSKTCDGKSVDYAKPKIAAHGANAPDLSWAKCSSDVDPIDDTHTAKCGADSLERTFFMSNIAQRGNWWKMEFDSEWNGRVSVLTGTLSGEHRLLQGALEASGDGVKWEQVGRVSKKDGVATGRLRSKHRFIRLRVTDSRPRPLVIRDVRFD